MPCKMDSGVLPLSFGEAANMTVQSPGHHHVDERHHGPYEIFGYFYQVR